MEWGHPFIDCTERMAYVASGSAGYFATRGDECVARRLADEAVFRSKADRPIGRYPLWPTPACMLVRSSAVSLSHMWRWT